MFRRLPAAGSTRIPGQGLKKVHGNSFELKPTHEGNGIWIFEIQVHQQQLPAIGGFYRMASTSVSTLAATIVENFT